MAALREPLVEFVTDVFASTRFDQRDSAARRLLHERHAGRHADRSSARRARPPLRAWRPSRCPPGGARQGVLHRAAAQGRDVRRVGLAGVNRRVEVQKGALQVGAYAALVLAAVLGVVLLSVLYNRNVAYMNSVGAEAKKLERVGTASSGASLDVVLNRLDAVHNLGSRRRFTHRVRAVGHGLAVCRQPAEPRGPPGVLARSG